MVECLFYAQFRMARVLKGAFVGYPASSPSHHFMHSCKPASRSRYVEIVVLEGWKRA